MSLTVTTALLVMSMPLSMDEAVHEALSGAPELRAAHERVASSEAKVEAAGSAYYPRVSIDAQYLARTPKSELPITLPPSLGLPPIGDIDDLHHLTADLKLGYRLLDLTRGPRQEAAAHAVEAERAAVATTRADLAFGVRAAFLAALYARDVAAIAETSLVLAEESEAQTRLRAEAGVVSRVALAQARVRVASLRAAAGRAKNEALRYRTQLRIFLGRDSLPTLVGNLTELATDAVPDRTSPQLEKLAHQKRSVEAMRSATARRLVPTVSLFAAAGVAYPRALQLEFGPVLQAGASLEWVGFDGFLRESETTALDHDAAALDAMADATRRALDRAAADLAAREATARGDLESADRTLAESRIYLDVAKTARRAGTGTDLDIHTAELGLDRAKVAKKKAEFDLALVRAESLRVRGIAETETKQ